MPRLPLDNHGHGHSRRPRRRLCLRATCPYVLVFVLFSLSLATYGLLSASLPSPARKQRIGWQAWDTVRPGSNGTEEVAASLPLDEWDPMAAHTTGLTEFAVKRCLISPRITRLCWPDSTEEDDTAKGKWVLVEVDLNSGGAGFWNLFLYYRRTRRLDVPLVQEMRVYPDPAPADADLDGWIQAPGNLREGQRDKAGPLRLWYKTTTERGDIVTEVMPLFGDGEAFFGFQRVEGGKITTAKDGRWDSVDLTYRRGNPAPPAAGLPMFHEDGTFKIMQIADLHYSVGTGACRDTNKRPCTGDGETEKWLAEALDAEKPDLVVFSGDQLNGQKTSYDANSVLAKFAKPVMDRKIPWAAVFGNHDSEIAHDRIEQMRALQRMPYSLARAGPLDVDGVGNYDVRVYSADARTHVFTLYFLDSGAYQPTIIPFVTPDYDYIHDSQVDWFRETSDLVDPIERPYRPASDARRRGSRLARESTMAKPNAMAWWHIPSQESYGPADVDEHGNRLEVGSALDGQGSSKHKSGMFNDGILAARERDGSPTPEVKVISHGHCHLTDRCRRVSGVWACFDGGSSFSGYGDPQFDRRVRVYALSDWGETISTYKRMSAGEVIDQQVLVGEAK